MEPESFGQSAFVRISAISRLSRGAALIFLVALALLPAHGQVIRKLGRRGKANPSGRESRIPSEAMDVGDFYQMRTGQRHLLRSVGMLAIKFHDASQSNEVLNALLNGPLAGYERHSFGRHGIVLLKASDAVHKLS